MDEALGQSFGRMVLTRSDGRYPSTVLLDLTLTSDFVGRGLVIYPDESLHSESEPRIYSHGLPIREAEFVLNREAWVALKEEIGVSEEDWPLEATFDLSDYAEYMEGLEITVAIFRPDPNRRAWSGFIHGTSLPYALGPNETHRDTFIYDFFLEEPSSQDAVTIVVAVGLLGLVGGFLSERQAECDQIALDRCGVGKVGSVKTYSRLSALSARIEETCDFKCAP